MWFLYAVLAAVFWGMNYSIFEQLMRKLSLGAMLIGMALCNVAMAAIVYALTGGKLRQDLTLLQTDMPLFKLFLGMLAAGGIASLFIFLSIRGRNATMAAMIEIAYPLFTALFAWLFFRETQVNTGTLAGAVLMMAGVSCIYFYGKHI